MTAASKIDVVFLWHMHQPEYRNLLSGEYELPWTYLHAIRDYVDMAWHLENCPAMRCVVNFTPLLLEQIDDYAKQCSRWAAEGVEVSDPMLGALTKAVMPANERVRTHLIESCLRANEKRVIDRFEPFQKLARIARSVIADHESVEYLSNQFLTDLVTWYHLGWLGESVRRHDARVQALMKKAGGYTLHDRRDLMQIISGLLGSLLGRYRLLSESGQVELSCSAYAHPILPLLLSFEVSKDALPGAHLPLLDHYPGGAERAQHQIEEGYEVFARYFGVSPRGVWPSEGGVSDATLELLSAHGVEWCATGESVLHHTMERLDANRKPRPHHGFKRVDDGVTIFFRSDEISDAIGFRYADWHAEDAVADLTGKVIGIADRLKGSERVVVSIIMDGENAWEHYPENAWHFLSELYSQLTHHERIAVTTFRDHLAANPEVESLPPLVSGSWVYGTFSTWIGDEEKCRAWDVLGEAKRVYDEVVAEGQLTPSQLAQIERQLSVCEGSDWFWWLGDYNPRDAVRDFERLFRLHISNLYVLMKREPPQHLSEILAHGHGGAVHGGTMLPSTEPPVD